MRRGDVQAAVSVIVVGRLQQGQKGRQKSRNVANVASVQHAAAYKIHRVSNKCAEGKGMAGIIGDVAPADDTGRCSAQRVLGMPQHGF